MAFRPFLKNCATLVARINRIAVYSADIIKKGIDSPQTQKYCARAVTLRTILRFLRFTVGASKGYL